jgi:uncharacterized SAM-binding protein YcdF (DUF218 family)
MVACLLRYLRIALMVAGGFLLFVTLTPVVRWTATWLSSNWTDSDGDVLIVLKGSELHVAGVSPDRIIGESTYWRCIYAIQAWHQGHFRAILLSGEGSAETMKPLLLLYGVPEGAILVEDRSTSTHENALFAKAILAGLSKRRVLLTSDYHMFRASRCFARENIPVATRPFPDLIKRSGSWQFRWQGFWILADEFVKIGYYRARGWI